MADLWVRDSLFVAAGIYAALGNGEYVFYGERPKAGWHGHGYCEKTLTMLAGREPVAMRLGGVCGATRPPVGECRKGWFSGPRAEWNSGGFTDPYLERKTIALGEARRREIEGGGSVQETACRPLLTAIA